MKLIFFLIILFIIFISINMNKTPIEAVAVLTNTTIKKLKGFIIFKEDLKRNETIIKINISGLQR